MGVCFNFLFAFVILLVSALIFGSQDLTPTITKVETGYPAFEAGLTPNDKILEINGHKITYLDDVSLYFAIENLDKPLDIKVLKENDEIRNYSILPNKITDDEGTPTYQIGITLTAKQRHGFFAPIIYAFQKECALFKQMFVVLGNLVTGKVSFNQLGGPVGIFSVVGQMKNEGVNALLYLVALLSINVGVINILPFPAFDGGRIALLVVEKIKGSPVNPKVENAINGVGFILLMILMVFVTINDILRLI